ncbi:nickel-dependent hydrogenase large subunit [Hyphomicrobium denitrificans]|nr:nickel-dependent hydrogenase large subunit [Hyphomicrobium denitrificans]
MIDLRHSGDGTGRIAITSSRPLGLARAFVGRSADEAVLMLPMLFNVCAMAQGAAAAQACERALGIESDKTTDAVRRVLVLAETLREHLIRTVLDWPRFLGFEAGQSEMLAVMRPYEKLRRSLDPERRVLAIGGRARFDPASVLEAIEVLAQLVEAIIFGESLDAWRTRQSAEALTDWSEECATPSQRLVRTVLNRGWAEAGRATTQFLPHIEDGDLSALLLGDSAATFVAEPTWGGRPHETSALSRQADTALVRDVARMSGGNGLLTRIAARLVEVGCLPGVMRGLVEGVFRNEAGQPPTPAARERCGRGLAQVEAARGRLVHGVAIEDGIVRRYEVLAPTEWNFHADGAAAHGLAEIAGRQQDAREIADLFVTAVDPCVGYELRVH